MQTARFKDGSTNLLKDMPALEMESMEALPNEKTLEIDTSKTYQEILGFGGAFTEASAINWQLLSAEQQKEVIRLYFADPKDGGHGYTLGRVPMNSCDFSPASYSFDDVTADVDLDHFDHSVAHDVEVGMIPMMQQAQDLVQKRGLELNIYASPWSPPAWMKLPVGGDQSMVKSASPNGLMPSMQRPWAKYFSKFINAYAKHGLKMWGVTVQNEPEAAVGWEACLWTPKYMAQFVRDHLGPVLANDHPDVKIIGYDHNKDHLNLWAKELYADTEALKFFDGIGVHWYGGLNTHNLEYAHKLAPDKFILATEACNCGGVVFKDGTYADGMLTKGDFLPAWWSRAEGLALDILEDLRYWAVGWTDWNLVLSPSGGPNHLKNLCDANIIADPEHTVGDESIILQASYYYMGHFSRFFPPGAKRVALKNTVEAHFPPLQPGDVKNYQALLFAPCDGSAVQQWELDDTGSLIIRNTNEAESSDGYEHGGMCMDVVTPPSPWIDGKMQVFACAHTPSQDMVVQSVPGGSQILHAPTGKCVTAIQTSGSAVGLDQGVTIVAGQLKECAEKGDPSQTFVLANYDAQGFPANFPIRTLPSAPGGNELCLQPQIARLPHFDAVAFAAPDGSVSLVAMNIGDNPVEFTLTDKAAHAGVRHLTIPPHAIHSYKYTPPTTTVAAVATPASAVSLAAMPAAASAGSGSSSSSGGWMMWSGLVCGVAVAVGAVLYAVVGTRADHRLRIATEDGGEWAACERATEYAEFEAPSRRHPIAGL